jgi:hypothetical protein
VLKIEMVDSQCVYASRTIWHDKYISSPSSAQSLDGLEF